MPDPNAPGETAHATCIALGEAGLLIRGESGTGKSTLALLLLDRADLIGLPAALVGDDRVRLIREGGGLTAQPHPALQGRIELRGVGLCRILTTRDRVGLALVVDLVSTVPRLPEPSRDPVEILGLSLPRLVLDGAVLRSGLAPRLVLDALAGCTDAAFGTHRKILALPYAARP